MEKENHKELNSILSINKDLVEALLKRSKIYNDGFFRRYVEITLIDNPDFINNTNFYVFIYKNFGDIYKIVSEKEFRFLGKAINKYNQIIESLEIISEDVK